MLNWLRRRQAAPEPPGYTAIAQAPTRGVPQVIADAENSDEFASRCEALQASLLDEQPPADAPLFTHLGTSEGLVTIPIPDGSGQCLPIFTSVLRAGDYARVHFGSAHAVQFQRASALELAEVASSLWEGGVRSAAVDRCPRCTTFMASDLHGGPGAAGFIALWAIARASQTARAELWLSYAEEALRAGDHQIARDVALECVSHVTPDLRRAHVLLRDVALATGDLTLLSEARTFLEFPGLR